MKLDELRGKPVVLVAEALRVGVVEDALVDPSYQRIQGLRIRANGRGHDYVVASESVRGIGPDAVTVVDRDALQSPERAPGLGGLPRLSAVVGSRVLTEGGKVLGSVTDVDLDPATGQVQEFEYSAGGLAGLFGRRLSFNARDLVGIGRGVVTIVEPARPSQAA